MRGVCRDGKCVEIKVLTDARSPFPLSSLNPVITTLFLRLPISFTVPITIDATSPLEIAAESPVAEA
jgi:hypothetical protein